MTSPDNPALFELDGYAPGGRPKYKCNLTRRDLLAGVVMHGLMARYQEQGYTDTSAAVEAYRIADAMLEARDDAS